MTDITNATEVEAKREPWPTLYIAVRRDDDEPPYFWTSPARSTADEARDHFYDTCRVFRIPSTVDADNGGSKKSDPTDAAELERLREAKYQAELDMRTTAMSRDVPTAVSPRVWNAWITACDRLSAFEKTIGGGS